MTKQRNRVNLTLSDELYDTLTELSELSKTPKASIINELLTEVEPQLKVSIKLIKSVRDNQMKMSDARNLINNLLYDAGDVIHDAQGQLNHALKEINKETDEELDNATNSRKSD